MTPHTFISIPLKLLHLLTGLLLYMSTLPILLTWRLSLALLHPFPLYTRALSHYQHHRAALHTLPILQPIIKHRIGITCTALLLTQATLAVALVEKSLMHFSPWFSAHARKTEYKLEHDREWRSEIFLYVSGFLLICSPFCGTLGVGVGVLWYMREIWMYWGFDGEEVDGQFEEKEEVRLGVKSGEGDGFGVMEDPVLPLEISRCGELVVSKDLGDVQDWKEVDISVPLPVMVPASQERFKRNPYTLAGVMAIWGWGSDRASRGYDGRNVRRRNFEEDIEMDEGSERT
ncbi:hypothetical protein COCC4DRAFT_61419 [Bipolaris maydis ATCC 48331]|uniref:Uncharacterized protein n=2 Tax=Cochliobolus heterostrophus TaxID=5016 RepID=M2UGH4_COCH5|nr:uncharacterized protein COCC4DRAFT_61419 [Bipolaris maydis ATCC 48331]EMD92806.1 hypothetical protein COCHEDRAFT_1029072 [Bipolaris maydis C5]KAJ5056644.1 hypothetical protein J3E74DRAFT_225421 [Bipolaris maydis]ENI04805.1 hypothetical protein COCC4DRAFT_61419 [Bipolaris maydis ATCC 48331]KAJ6196233.1 hypothetical protein J3E72DRAFT_195582 [Bipolaris maydis]KAJ6208334.1 hypothetical protein PSV09DRAFT_1029072 [Bipolaris maydis]